MHPSILYNSLFKCTENAYAPCAHIRIDKMLTMTTKEVYGRLFSSKTKKNVQIFAFKSLDSLNFNSLPSRTLIQFAQHAVNVHFITSVWQIKICRFRCFFSVLVCSNVQNEIWKVPAGVRKSEWKKKEPKSPSIATHKNAAV